MATGLVALEPPSSPLPFQTDINPGAALSWPENRVLRRRHQELGRSVKETFEGSKP
ncbi:hypothetical protein Prudu_102S001900 [Prunus dulcis]|uniref:Uncharacterized protein n=1 Tax=Prunus dulcis TaxID=3755 RepID=A0A5H2XK28_PRUDU|nr:hypothetical protein Prudu_102S001900 [Prunus dulcis]